MDGMAMALAEAKAALAEGEIPVGAALFRGGTLVCSDHNRREQLHDPTAHAELLCLRRGGEMIGNWRLSECTLYVTLEPCPMCAGALVMSRLGLCVFGAGACMIFAETRPCGPEPAGSRICLPGRNAKPCLIRFFKERGDNA